MKYWKIGYYIENSHIRITQLKNNMSKNVIIALIC